MLRMWYSLLCCLFFRLPCSFYDFKIYSRHYTGKPDSYDWFCCSRGTRRNPRVMDSGSLPSQFRNRTFPLCAYRFVGRLKGIYGNYLRSKPDWWHKTEGKLVFNRFLSFLYTLIFAAMLVLSLIVIVFGNQILLIIDSFFSIDTPLFIGIFSLRSIAGFAIFFFYFYFCIPLFHITMNARIYEIMYPVLYLPLLHGSYSAISTRSISILFRIIHLFMGVSLRSHSLCCGCMSVSVCCLSVL